ncbi:MAG: hypothetical protein ACRDU8_05075 [Egibacteraceae bacterium]
MRLLASRSEVVTDDQGWVWLQPQRASIRYRHTFASFLLALVVLVAMATATLLPPPAAVPATAGVSGLGVLLVIRTARDGQTRLGLSAVGILMAEGLRVAQVGWDAVEGLYGIGAGSRVRITLAAGRDSRTTRVGFDRSAAREWLQQATAEAGRRRLEPVPVDEGLGFTAGGVAG